MRASLILVLLLAGMQFLYDKISQSIPE
jgi:hypothetical protein